MPPDVAGPTIGDMAPDFELEEANGDNVRLGTLRGRPILLIFYRGEW